MAQYVTFFCFYMTDSSIVKASFPDSAPYKASICLVYHLLTCIGVNPAPPPNASLCHLLYNNYHIHVFRILYHIHESFAISPLSPAPWPLNPVPPPHIFDTSSIYTPRDPRHALFPARHSTRRPFADLLSIARPWPRHGPVSRAHAAPLFSSPDTTARLKNFFKKNLTLHRCGAIYTV